jgi:hypothetical protein
LRCVVISEASSQLPDSVVRIGLILAPKYENKRVGLEMRQEFQGCCLGITSPAFPRVGVAWFHGSSVSLGGELVNGVDKAGESSASFSRIVTAALVEPVYRRSVRRWREPGAHVASHGMTARKRSERRVGPSHLARHLQCRTACWCGYSSAMRSYQFDGLEGRRSRTFDGQWPNGGRWSPVTDGLNHKREEETPYARASDSCRC